MSSPCQSDVKAYITNLFNEAQFNAKLKKVPWKHHIVTRNLVSKVSDIVDSIFKQLLLNEKITCRCLSNRHLNQSIFTVYGKLVRSEVLKVLPTAIQDVLSQSEDALAPARASAAAAPAPTVHATRARQAAAAIGLAIVPAALARAESPVLATPQRRSFNRIVTEEPTGLTKAALDRVKEQRGKANTQISDTKAEIKKYSAILDRAVVEDTPSPQRPKSGREKITLRLSPGDMLIFQKKELNRKTRELGNLQNIAAQLRQDIRNRNVVAVAAAAAPPPQAIPAQMPLHARIAPTAQATNFAAAGSNASGAAGIRRRIVRPPAVNPLRELGQQKRKIYNDREAPDDPTPKYQRRASYSVSSESIRELLTSVDRPSNGSGSGSLRISFNTSGSARTITKI